MSSDVVVFPPMEFVGNVSGTEGSSGRVSLSNSFDDGLGPAETNSRYHEAARAVYLPVQGSAAGRRK